METVRFIDFFLVCYYFTKKAIGMLTVSNTGVLRKVGTFESVKKSISS